MNGTIAQAILSYVNDEKLRETDLDSVDDINCYTCFREKVYLDPNAVQSLIKQHAARRA